MDVKSEGRFVRTFIENRHGIPPGVENVRKLSIFVQLEDGHEGFGRNRDGAKGTHPLLAFLLLFQQLLLTGDVAAVALGENVLAQRLDGLPGDDLAADGGLNGDFKLGAGDVLLQLFADLPGAGIALSAKRMKLRRPQRRR